MRLGIPTVRDRVLQAESSIRTESLKLGFSNHSYGFRPGRSQRQALEAAQKTVKEGKEYVVDLERFFARIHHDRLFNRMKLQISDKRILRLTGMVLKIWDHGRWFGVGNEGSAQGSPLNSLLSNVVWMNWTSNWNNRIFSYVRQKLQSA